MLQSPKENYKASLDKIECINWLHNLYVTALNYDLV